MISYLLITSFLCKDLPQSNYFNSLKMQIHTPMAAQGKRSLPSKQDATDFIFSKNGLTYHDTYCGTKQFIEEEIV